MRPLDGSPSICQLPTLIHIFSKQDIHWMLDPDEVFKIYQNLKKIILHMVNNQYIYI